MGRGAGEGRVLLGLIDFLFFSVIFLPASLGLAYIWSDECFPESCGHRLVLQLTVARPLSPDAGSALYFKVKQSLLISLLVLNWPTFSEGWGRHSTFSFCLNKPLRDTEESTVLHVFSAQMLEVSHTVDVFVGSTGS